MSESGVRNLKKGKASNGNPTMRDLLNHVEIIRKNGNNNPSSMKLGQLQPHDTLSCNLFFNMQIKDSCILRLAERTGLRSKSRIWRH